MSTASQIGRVAIDARMLFHSGIGVVLRNVLEHWAREGGPKLYLLGDVDRLRASLPPFPDAQWGAWDPPVYSLRAAVLPPKLPRDVRVWFGPHYATCLRPPVRMVCHIHDVLHISHPTRFGTREFMRGCLALLARKAAFVTVPSRHVKVQLQTLYGFRPDRVLIAENGKGVVESLPAGELTVPELLRGMDYFLAVGILKPHKNWPFLLRRLAGMKDVALTLVCLGLGRDRGRLLAMARKVGLEGRVIVLDHLPPEELAGTIASAKALLFPSRAEGFGLPILEAMELGTPVVTAERSPMKEVAGEAAFYFDPDWPESFDEAVRRVLGNESDRQHRIRIGQERAAKYSWRRTAEVIEQALYRAATGDLPQA